MNSALITTHHKEAPQARKCRVAIWHFLACVALFTWAPVVVIYLLFWSKQVNS